MIRKNIGHALLAGSTVLLTAGAVFGMSVLSSAPAHAAQVRKPDPVLCRTDVYGVQGGTYAVRNVRPGIHGSEGPQDRRSVSCAPLKSVDGKKITELLEDGYALYGKSGWMWDPHAGEEQGGFVLVS